jgi:polysaccharide export outer membrane protein
LYGSVTVAGRTREDAQKAIEEHLKTALRQPIAAVFILKKAPPQGLASQFVVEPDGTVNLDSRLSPGLEAGSDATGRVAQPALRFGSLALAGKTKEEARLTIEEHVRTRLPNPQVSVSVLRMAEPERIAGTFQIEPEGTVNLDAPLNAPTDPLAAAAGLGAAPERLLNVVTRYGSVAVAGLTREQAQQAIADYLQRALPQPQVSVSVLQMAGLQQIAGQHLVGPDGTVTLGTFGSVSVVGGTLADAKQAIEQHLSRYLDRPEVAVDVYAFNSKTYYVVLQGAGAGDAVYKFPITGNETVLDALTAVGGFEYVSSMRMWVARPTPNTGSVQILPVDWESITAQGAVATNYQLMPGDRVFVAENELVALDTNLAKVLAPVERAMGFSMLGVQTVSRFSGRVLQGGGLQGFFGGN